MKYIFLTLLSLASLSCDFTKSTEIEELKEGNKKLKAENKMLKTENKQLEISINKFEQQDLQYRQLVGIINGKIQVGKKNRIDFLLHSFKEIPKYEIFKIEDNKEIKVGSNNLSSFKYEFIPKSLKDTNIKLKVKIPYENEIIEIQGEMIVPVE